jgi:two-component system chemotaxis sensor kinase CheA
LFTPGFSTAAKVTELSGRGVGLDVLRSTIEMMHGTVRLSSIKDAGMRLEITLPLTVAFLEAMVVRVHGWLLAVPIEKVHHVERVAANRLVSDPASGAVLVRFDDGLVPLVRLDRFFGSGAATDSNVTHGANVADGADQLLVVAHAKRGRLAFPVDALLGNQQVMLKPMTGVLQNIRASAGYGVLRSGDVALTLDCEHIHAN